MRILAFDPGATTGWSLVQDCGNYTIVETGEVVLGCRSDVGKVIELLSRGPDIVITEGMVATGRLNSDKIAQARSDGVIYALCLLFASHAKWVRQSPEELKNFDMPKVILEQIHGQHAKDATKHAFICLGAVDWSENLKVTSSLSGVLTSNVLTIT